MQLTFQLIASIGSLVPLIDCSDLVAVHRRQQRLMRQRSIDSEAPAPSPHALSSSVFSSTFTEEVVTPAPRLAYSRSESESESDESDHMIDVGPPVLQQRLANGELVLDLSPEEEALCQSTRQCEDFLVQFMDRYDLSTPRE